MAPTIPKLEYTAVDDIVPIVHRVRNTFHTQKTKPLEFRLLQLRKLYWAIKDHEAELLEANKVDLGKGIFEAMLTEISWVTNDIVSMCKNLEKWAKDEKPADIPFTNSFVKPRIRKDPLGCVLVIGTYNFPVNLTVGPLVGAIAAGNTVVLKPSENAPTVAVVLKQIIEKSLDPEAFAVVQGGVPETTLLLEQKWDKIFYTGSATVGTIIAKKAAETLTPVTLELGGRNPAIITKNADVRLAARRLLWTKILNAGQVCISHNYTIIDKEVLPGYIAELKSSIKDFFPNGIKASPDFGRIINNRQWSRLKQLLDNTKGKILFGGSTDEAQRFIELTLIQIEDFHDPMIMEESFGPLMPIVAVDNLDEAIKIANEVQATPLAIYPFGNRKETDRMLRELRSGGASVNDGLQHGSIPGMPFGGVGDSGQGAYRGKASFDCFSHHRSITTTPGWMERLLEVRYPPYEGKLAKTQRMIEQKPDFDRDGKVKFSVVNYILKLGAGSLMGGAARYVLVLLAAIGIRQYLARTS
ncbi:MAG: hypothetical protein Q9191_005159 [Dirinaria sp. TL-2023a]